MLHFQPIAEPDVIALLNTGRFEGEVEGYIVMEGPDYHGYALFRLDGEAVALLDASLDDPLLLDGALRACLAAGEKRGAARFWVNADCPPLAAWGETHGALPLQSAPIAPLWRHCGG